MSTYRPPLPRPTPIPINPPPRPSYQIQIAPDVLQKFKRQLDDAARKLTAARARLDRVNEALKPGDASTFNSARDAAYQASGLCQMLADFSNGTP